MPEYSERSKLCKMQHDTERHQTNQCKRAVQSSLKEFERNQQASLVTGYDVAQASKWADLKHICSFPELTSELGCKFSVIEVSHARSRWNNSTRQSTSRSLPQSARRLPVGSFQTARSARILLVTAPGGTVADF